MKTDQHGLPGHVLIYLENWNSDDTPSVIKNSGHYTLILTGVMGTYTICTNYNIYAPYESYINITKGNGGQYPETLSIKSNQIKLVNSITNLSF